MPNKLNYEDVLKRANVLLKNYVEKTYKKSHPDLDMNLVEVRLLTETEVVFQALIELINENK